MNNVWFRLVRCHFKSYCDHNRVYDVSKNTGPPNGKQLELGELNAFIVYVVSLLRLLVLLMKISFE